MPAVGRAATSARMRAALSRVVLIYLVFGLCFVVGTEMVLASMDHERFRLAIRLLYLALSTVMLIVLVRRELVRRVEMEDRLLHSQHSESLTRMAGGVAHDFNNLLTVILGYTDIVLGDLGLDHPSAPDLLTVRRSGEQARALVDQLLTLSRNRVVQAANVSPQQTIDSLREVFRRLVGDVDVELDVLLFEVPDVFIDPSQLEQVLLNLIINARDATPRGGRVTLTTSTGRLPDGRSSVDIRVTDTGTGMDEETLAHCFEPFFTTKERAESTGLGLATVAAIVARAEGEISVDTEVGRGTSFLVQLPAVARQEEEAPPAVDLRGGAEHVLIVEDDDKVRLYARRVLEDNGYVANEVANGVDAITLVKTGERPDLVVTDVLMPSMGGVELAEHLRELVPDTPVLFVSGYAEDPRIHDMAGDVAFLPKPFTPPDLLRAVRRAIDGPERSTQGSKR